MNRVKIFIEILEKALNIYEKRLATEALTSNIDILTTRGKYVALVEIKNLINNALEELKKQEKEDD